MKRALLPLTLLLCASAVQAQSLDPTAPLKSYATKVLPRCPGGALTLEKTNGGPTNFTAYVATLRSDDQYCGQQKYLLHSPKSGQIILGSVITLPADNRPVDARVAEETSKLLKHTMTATVAPFPLPDGLRAVSISRNTPFGPFSYQGFIDGSNNFLIIGLRGNLSTDPVKTMRDALGASNAARRGSATSKVEILELSDFQCPSCARAHEKVEPLIQKNLSKMSYMRLDLPLFEHHEWAIPAAMAARAIQRVAPAKYWHYVDHVFKNQESIGKRPFDQTFKDYVEDNDLDWSALQKIYASRTERAALLDQVSRAFSVGINSTPTFIINGQIMGFGPEGAFTINAIESALGVKATPAKKSAK